MHATPLSLMMLVASAFREKIYIYLLHLVHHGTQCLFCSCFFAGSCCKFACCCACVASISRCAQFGADVLEIERFGGLAHAARLGLFKFNIKMRQPASYKSKYHPSLCFRLQFINRWHLCVPAAVLQKSHGPLLRRISLLVITFARGLFRLLHAGLKN